MKAIISFSGAAGDLGCRAGGGILILFDDFTLGHVDDEGAIGSVITRPGAGVDVADGFEQVAGFGGGSGL
jgi:hypothetical protein